MQYKNKGPPKRSSGVLQTGIVYCFFFTTKPITNKIIAGITKNKAFTNTHK